MGMPQPVVGAAWLAEHLGDVRLVDSRWYLDGRSGRAAYERGHLPGAIWVDLDRDLAGPPSPDAGRHPLPSPQNFAATMSRLGIGDDTSVVIYDDARGSIAARLWWMLRMHDHHVAVLDGGIDTWRGDFAVGWHSCRPAAFTARPWPAARLVDADQIEVIRQRRNALVLDARSAARYAHGDPSIDPRPGHIPGARSAPWVDNLRTDGTMLDRAALRERFTALGAADAEIIACSCGSGVTACHDLLALELAGFGDTTRLYPGSWSQWGADPRRDAAVGPDSVNDGGS